MSSDPHPHGDLVNDNVHHEENDINIRAIIAFVVVLAAVTIAIQIAMYGLFAVFNTIETRTEPGVSPLAASAATPAAFPEPRLQTTPWSDLKQLRASENLYLHSYGWMDQTAGVARIPIEKAKALLLQKGLPVRPEAADPTEGTHVAAMGESSGGRNLPAGGPDKSSGAGAPAASAPPAASQPAPKGPGGGQ